MYKQLSGLPGKSTQKIAEIPSVIIPYEGPATTTDARDIFLYLRPESNGILVESLLLRVIKSEKYSSKSRVVYLANMPGSFVMKNRIIEQHNAVKIRFARVGKKAFTSHMREQFERFFQQPFKKAPILGAFQALRKFHVTYEDLFNCWVPPENYSVICGQSIKFCHDHYIINYDIPAILHKNTRRTDFAVMIFRSSLTNREFLSMVEEMKESLIKERAISPDRPLARTFHYSSGPFEQILDGIGYLYDQEGKHLSYSQISFYRYLLDHGFGEAEILDAVRNPIMRFMKQGKCIEENLFFYTADDTYYDALQKYSSRVKQR